jgi:hypothetical protein
MFILAFVLGVYRELVVVLLYLLTKHLPSRRIFSKSRGNRKGLPLLFEKIPISLLQGDLDGHLRLTRSRQRDDVAFNWLAIHAE